MVVPTFRVENVDFVVLLLGSRTTKHFKLAISTRDVYLKNKGVTFSDSKIERII